MGPCVRRDDDCFVAALLAMTVLKKRAALSVVVARLDRATRYSRGLRDQTEKPRRTG
jgi:hypothetical protein